MKISKFAIVLALAITPSTHGVVGKLFLIVGAPGTGKTSLVNYAISKYKEPLNLHCVIQYTTRTQRINEKNGLDYHFVSQEEFEQLKKERQIFEDFTFEYRGNQYGPPSDTLTLLRNNYSCLLVTDYRQVPNFMARRPETIVILVTTSERDETAKRLQARGTLEQELNERLAFFDYVSKQEKISSFCKYTIVNDNFDTACQELMAILKKEITP
jgi:guanylate kinase